MDYRLRRRASSQNSSEGKPLCSRRAAWAARARAGWRGCLGLGAGSQLSEAQEVQEHIPNVVHEGNNGYLQMDYSKLVTPLVKAIQELSAEIEELKKK